jgi:hypothetical protein
VIFLALLFGWIRFAGDAAPGLLGAAVLFVAFGVFCCVTGGPPGGPTLLRRRK